MGDNAVGGAVVSTNSVVGIDDGSAVGIVDGSAVGLVDGLVLTYSLQYSGFNSLQNISVHDQKSEPGNLVQVLQPSNLTMHWSVTRFFSSALYSIQYSGLYFSHFIFVHAHKVDPVRILHLLQPSNLKIHLSVTGFFIGLAVGDIVEEIAVGDKVGVGVPSSL